MKPTHGLVPYTGIMPIESTLDHAGPMTQNVADNALMLEVIAGADGLDPRQYDVVTDTYTRAVTAGASGLKIGIVKEGFGHDSSEADVDQKVRAAANILVSVVHLLMKYLSPGTLRVCQYGRQSPAKARPIR